jgi:hypothetical protein
MTPEMRAALDPGTGNGDRKRKRSSRWPRDTTGRLGKIVRGTRRDTPDAVSTYRMPRTLQLPLTVTHDLQLGSTDVISGIWNF